MPQLEILVHGVLDGHKDAVYALAKGKGPRTFFSSGGDGMVISWDLEHKGEGELIARLPSAVYALLYFAEVDILVAATRFGGLYMLDLDGKKQKKLVQLKQDIFCLCFLLGQKMIAAGTAGGYIYILDGETLETVHEIHPCNESCRALALSPDGKHLASGWSDGKIRVYNISDFNETQSFTAHIPSAFSLVYNALGDKLISGGRDAQIRIWDTGSSYSEAQKIPAHLFTVNDLILIPEQGLMASASRDKTAKIWDAENFDLLKVIDRPKLPAHSHSVNKLLWINEGKTLISAGDDKLIRLWGIIC